MRVALTVAGSDSGGGAGIQADLKTFHQFGVFGTTVVVAVTAQDTTGVTAVHPVPADTVSAQFAAVAADLFPAALKSGMLATRALVDLVAEHIARHRFPRYVLDPVMVATSGDRLLEPEAERHVLDRLVPLAAIVTPNLDEAELLLGGPVRTERAMAEAGRALLARGAGAVLLKGGHLADGIVVDLLVTADDVRRFPHERIDTRNTHGTGCTLSAAIAAGLARGSTVDDAVARAVDFVHRAIAQAPGLGRGHGPLNHFVPPRSDDAP